MFGEYVLLKQQEEDLSNEGVCCTEKHRNYKAELNLYGFSLKTPNST